MFLKNFEKKEETDRRSRKAKGKEYKSGQRRQKMRNNKYAEQQKLHNIKKQDHQQTQPQ